MDGLRRSICHGVGNQTNTDAALAAAGATIGGLPIGDGLGDACDDDGTVNAGDLGPIAETWQRSCT